MQGAPISPVGVREPRSPSVRRVSLLGVIALIAVGAVVPGGMRRASAIESQGRLIESIDRVFDMVVTDDHVFLSDDDGNRVAVTDHDGNEVALLTDVPGASGMAIDGDTLYIGAVQGSRIDRFDLSTSPPTRLSSWDTSSVGRPWWIAIAGGFLWFTGCNEIVLGRVNLTTGNVTDRTPADLDDLSACAKLEHSPFSPDTLVVHVQVGGGDPIKGYDVSSGLPVEVFDEPDAPTHPIELEVLPGGNQWVSASHGAPAVRFALGDLGSPTATYVPHNPSGTPGFGLAVTQRNDGMIASVYGLANEYGEPDVQIWKTGEQTAFRTFSLLNQYDPYRDAVEFSPDGSRLFVAAPGVVLFPLDPRRKESRLEMTTDEEYVDYGDTLRFTLELTAGADERTVEIWGNPRGPKPSRLVRTVEVPLTGSISVSLDAVASTRYTAVFAGDEVWEPVSSIPLEVFVNHVIRGKMLRADGQDGDYAVYRRSSRIYYKATGTPVHRGEPFKITLHRRSDGGWREIGEGDFRQNDNGIVVIYLERGSLPSGRYAFTSWYGKDVLHRDGYSDMSLFRVR